MYDVKYPVGGFVSGLTAYFLRFRIAIKKSSAIEGTKGRTDQFNMPKATDDFFNSRSKRSEAKTTIVVKYFEAWANVIHATQGKFKPTANNRLAYIDLYAGKGKYDDGTASTPLLILEKAIASPILRQKLVTVFNDGKKEYAEELWKNIQAMPGINTLKYEPNVSYESVNDTITGYYKEANLVPALLFIDPFGYKGLTLELIDAVIRSWGCDCIFFFNYNGVNRAIRMENKKIKEHIDALFGKERADALREQVKDLTPENREEVIVSAIIEALRNTQANYVIPFRFAKEESESTSHYLIFLSKNPLGYKIMKEIMGKESSREIQDVPTFEFNPHEDQQPLLTMLEKPVDRLRDELPIRMSGQSKTTLQIYLEDSQGTNYLLRNYKKVLRDLWQAGKITVSRAPKTGFADNIVVTFDK